ncbi:GRIP and coiled-coil domain-containing protein 2-like [Amborella trichopoda]|uniref:Uncharacterized protein n=1 Tax=Amborella trichopoda TaxID=13333 RepID=W1PB26_AMBTC|nr:GRIP and coiled-coil domain-containing protein 2-like [Amborella trichopoda]ERN07112.1 hypothetical protein AMTR_s00019p00102620 [Amborella trichopoda]|eukprot:XP_020523617.1 GRIP and coiled-coil domain-containing protein 2-like [Amborella trichopoda]
MESLQFLNSYLMKQIMELREQVASLQCSKDHIVLSKMEQVDAEMERMSAAFEQSMEEHIDRTKFESELSLSIVTLVLSSQLSEHEKSSKKCNKERDPLMLDKEERNRFDNRVVFEREIYRRALLKLKKRKTKILELKKEVAELRSTESRLKKSIQELKAKNEGINYMRANAEAKVIELKKQVAQPFVKQVAQLLVTEYHLHNTMQELQGKNEAIDHIRAKQETMTAEMKKEVVKLRVTESHLHSSIQELKKENESINHTRVNQEAKMREFNKEVLQLKAIESGLQSSLKEPERKNKVMDSTRAKHRAKIGKLEKVVVQLRASEFDLQKSCQDLKEANSQLEAYFTDKIVAENEDYQRSFDMQKRREENLKGVIKEKERLNADMKQTLNATCWARNELEQHLYHGEGYFKFLSGVKASLRKRLQSSLSHQKQLESSLSQSYSKIQELEKQNEESEMITAQYVIKVSNLEMCNAKMNQKIKDMTENHNQMLREMKERETYQRANIEELQEEMLWLMFTKFEIQKSLEDIEEEYSQMWNRFNRVEEALNQDIRQMRKVEASALESAGSG